jgi:CheY-like chemotaxis protein
VSLEQASREKDLFLAMLSHELRTPLNSILLWSQVLRKDAALPEAAQRAAKGIEQSAKAQAQIVEDLLDISRIVSGKLHISRTDLDLCPLVSSIAETFQVEADAKQVQLAVAVDPTTPHVIGDSKRLRQIVWNLISNALKFTPSSGHVAVRLLPADGYARIEVEDDGIGIEPAFLPRVFERFAQQDSTTTRAHGGLGLGLALARHVVQLHAGRIRAENNPGGKGLTLTVELPAASKSPCETSESAPPAPRSSVDLRGVSVLVIDDDSECRDVVAHVLRERGAEVAVADSAQNARKLLETSTPDLIVCDVGMPIEDGLEFMRRLRAEPPARGGGIPAAALTAYADEQIRKAALEAGFQLHVPKPIEIEALLSAVASLRQTSVPG